MGTSVFCKASRTNICENLGGNKRCCKTTGRKVCINTLWEHVLFAAPCVGACGQTSVGTGVVAKPFVGACAESEGVLQEHAQTPRWEQPCLQNNLQEHNMQKPRWEQRVLKTSCRNMCKNLCGNKRCCKTTCRKACNTPRWEHALFAKPRVGTCAKTFVGTNAFAKQLVGIYTRNLCGNKRFCKTP